ncbi:hypothetical protein CYMTET_33614, partial [Cymbomonas tetramitiformis]
MKHHVLPIFIFLLSACLAAGDDDVTLVKCSTSKGPIRITVHENWAPIGAARFLDLVNSGFFTQVGLGRVVPNFLVQFGIAADPQVQRRWNAKGTILDDPDIHTPIKRGTIAFAGGGKNTRTTQIWISFNDNPGLGHSPWETAFAQVDPEDMHVVDSFYSGYGDMGAFGGKGPDQGRHQQEGNAYLRSEFPDLDYLLNCSVVPSQVDLPVQEEELEDSLLPGEEEDTESTPQADSADTIQRSEDEVVEE